MCALVILLPVVSVIQRRHTLTETLSSLQLIHYHLACLRILKILKINMFFKVDKAAFLKQMRTRKRNLSWEDSLFSSELCIWPATLKRVDNLSKYFSTEEHLSGTFLAEYQQFCSGGWLCKARTKMKMVHSSLCVEIIRGWSVMSGVQVLIFFKS